MKRTVRIINEEFESTPLAYALMNATLVEKEKPRKDSKNHQQFLDDHRKYLAETIEMLRRYGAPE